MANNNLTINEGLVWLKTLRNRHAELVALRNENAVRSRRYFGANADKETVTEPVYDVKKLDANVNRLAQEIRLVETAIKAANNATPIGVAANDSVLTAIE